MTSIDDLLTADLTAASRLVCTDVVPDLVASLDQLVPRLPGGDRRYVRRFAANVDAVVRALTELSAAEPARLPSAAVIEVLLTREALQLPLVAPTADGAGVVMVLVDRLRGLVGGIPSECTRVVRPVDGPQFALFAKVLADVELEREHSAPLRRAMAILDLSVADVAGLLGVTRQAVEQWLLAGVPPSRAPKIGALAEIADTLRYRLREGLPPVVVRRVATAYGDRSMLDLIRDDEHDWLLGSVRESFDFGRTA